jgi:hypothetical protein
VTCGAGGGAALTVGLVGCVVERLGLAVQLGIIAAVGWALMGMLQDRNRSPVQIPVRNAQHPGRTRATFGLRNAEPQ